MGLYQGGAQEDDSLTALRRARMSPTGSSLLGGGGTSPVAPPQPLMPKPRPTSPTGPGGAPGGPGGAAGQSAGGGGAPPATTFAQLQANGIARPAPPTPTPVTPGTAPAPDVPGTELAGSPGVTPFGGGQVNETTGGEAPPLKPEDDPNSPGGTGGPGGSPPPGAPPPPEPPGGTPTPPATPGSGKYPLQDDIEAQIKKLLGMGSPYDDAAFQNDIGREYNKIDDQYTLGQKDLGDNLARRGLGDANDSTIGLGRMSDLNVGRKSAKETVLSDLATKRATTQMDDLARVLGLATNYGQGAQALTLEQQQQQFNTQMQIAQLLAQLGYKTPAAAGR